MKKRNYSLLLLLPMLTLSACKPALVFVPYKDYVEEIDTHSKKEEDNFYRSGEVGSVDLPMTATFGVDTVTSFSQVAANHDAKKLFANRGELKLLVVPVAFKNKPVEQAEEKRTLLQNAFFGAKSKNSYESVASYYNKSSYGKVKITGEVAPWIPCDYTVSEAIAGSKSNCELVSRNIACQIREKLSTTDSININLNDYDTDGDSYIDAIYLVYDHPQTYAGDDEYSPLFWAYYDKVSKDYEGKNSESPYAYTYSWSSFYFTGSDSLSSRIVDANTYIHEVGHIFGLDDYYNTVDSNVAKYQPTGFMDMMDYNLGDHCSFSKYLLDWVSPMVVTKPGEITLKSFTKSGDFVLIPNGDWNGTVFDEYLLVEYFTPTGLNNSYSFPTYQYFDAENNERVFKYPTDHGVRVYHIDARLGYFDSRSPTCAHTYIDDPKLSDWASLNKGRYIDINNTNATPGYVDSSVPVLISLFEASGKNNFYHGIGADNSTLFKRGDDFGYSTYQDFQFNKVKSDNSKYQLDYKFKIIKMDTEEVTIKFEKK